MRKKIFTIIICCYNNNKYLKECLLSVINQKKNLFPYDVIFVDDKSTDNSLKTAKKLLKNFQNKRIIKNNKNIGLSKSCNKAISLCKTKYFIRVDSDDFIDENKIYFFEKNSQKNIDFIYCDRIEFNKKKNKKINIKNHNLFNMISCGVALKTKAIKKIGGYKNMLWEEYDLYIRYLTSKKIKIKKINKCLYYYRKHNKSMSARKTWLKNAWKELIKKYGEKQLKSYRNISYNHYK